MGVFLSAAQKFLGRKQNMKEGSPFWLLLSFVCFGFGGGVLGFVTTNLFATVLGIILITVGNFFLTMK